MATIPQDYLERVYAGVLGKIIGVYLGRPFEGWGYEKIMQELGEVWYYVHDRLNKPLIVTDDDISGTFTFIRALPDHGNRLDLTPEQIGQTWLNYLIENKTILWWGGLGNSTEHTAYLRLKQGIPAPVSGSIATNGRIVAEQIGAQIFIDGWALVAPGDPQRAADLARRAGSVSHDGEALYGAQCLAAMEAQAFVESDINRLLDTGLSVIPQDSIIYRMIGDIRSWYSQDGDWRKTFRRIEDQYGYKDYIGGCHMVPNHALIILGLLYGEGDFQKSLMICNTCGWDTDCNSGNLGCLMGIRNGLAGFEGAVDWRGPVADRMYLPTADGGRCVTDAVAETYAIANIGLALNGQPPLAPKHGARYHFELPGSVQGLQVDQGADCSPFVSLENGIGHSQAGARSLAIRYSHVGERVVARVTAPTYILPADSSMQGYELIASPTLYPGQNVQAGLWAGEHNHGPVTVSLSLAYYDANDQPTTLPGPRQVLAPGEMVNLQWQLPDPGGALIYGLSVEISRPDEDASEVTGTVYLDTLTWDGAPLVVFRAPSGASSPGAKLWRANWVKAVDQWDLYNQTSFRLIQNVGRGMISTGTREWTDYRVTARVRPAMVKSGGIAVRVQGLRRFYSLELTLGGKVRLLKAYEGDDQVLAEAACDWRFWQPYELSLEARGAHLRAWVDGRLLFDVEDTGPALTGGGAALVVDEGHLIAEEVQVGPAGA